MNGDFSNGLEQATGFIKFLSDAYGSGNPAVDSLAVGLGLLAVVFIVFLLHLTGFTKSREAREVEKLDALAELLNEMNLHLTETHGECVHEFHRCRGELGAIRQDLNDLKIVIRDRPILAAAAAQDAARNNRVPTFYPGQPAGR